MEVFGFPWGTVKHNGTRMLAGIFGEARQTCVLLGQIPENAQGARAERKLLKQRMKEVDSHTDYVVAREQLFSESYFPSY
jgi:hypothetical protein